MIEFVFEDKVRRAASLREALEFLAEVELFKSPILAVQIKNHFFMMEAADEFAADFE